MAIGADASSILRWMYRNSMQACALGLTAGLALTKRTIPPTAGFHATDTGLQLSSGPQKIEGEYALVNCFGCDGNNAALVLKGLN